MHAPDLQAQRPIAVLQRSTPGTGAAFGDAGLIKLSVIAVAGAIVFGDYGPARQGIQAHAGAAIQAVNAMATVAQSPVNVAPGQINPFGGSNKVAFEQGGAMKVIGADSQLGNPAVILKVFWQQAQLEGCGLVLVVPVALPTGPIAQAIAMNAGIAGAGLQKGEGLSSNVNAAIGLGV